MKHIYRIRSGGQTGADRGALDAALDCGVPITGWVPKGGWAEDMPDAPGLLAKYPQLKDSGYEDVNIRTRLNVRDSHATLIIIPYSKQDIPGTILTEMIALQMNRPYFVTDAKSIERTETWLNSLPYEITLNVAGPRESEVPGTYKKTYEHIKELLKLNEKMSVDDNLRA